MAKCIILSCKGTVDLFCVPEDKNKLRKWSNILKQTISSTDLICSRHFESGFIGTEKFLAQNAYPSTCIKQELLDSKCSVCFVPFGSLNHKHPHGLKESARKLVANGIGIIIPGPVCFRCFDKLSDVETFFNNIASKYSTMENEQLDPENQNSQSVEQADDDVEILPNPPVEIINVETISRRPQFKTLPITSHQNLMVTAVDKLKRKQKQSSNTDSTRDDNLNKPKIKSKSFECSVCDKQYTSGAYLKKHQLKHIADGQKDPKVKKTLRLIINQPSVPIQDSFLQ